MALKPCPHCGHPISEQAEKCPCCHQDPHLTPEELAHRQEAQQARKKAQQKRALRVVIPCVAVAALIVAALFLLPDYQRYQNAKKQMNAGEYLDAIENFDALGDYLSAPDLSLQCKAQAINSGLVSEASAASSYATALVSGGYHSGNGVVPGTVLWYRTDEELIEAQNQQKESEVCIVPGCGKPRLFGNYACADHDCAVAGCLYPAAAGESVCQDHFYMICKAFGCHAFVESGRYCPAHADDYAPNIVTYTPPAATTNENTNTSTSQNTNTAASSNENENTAPAQQEIPAQQPDNSAQQETNQQPENTQEPAQDPDNNASGQERKVRIYNKETGQWEWVSPDLSTGSNTTTENPHKGQKYVRQYNPETGTWDWMWVDD